MDVVLPKGLDNTCRFYSDVHTQHRRRRVHEKRLQENGKSPARVSGARISPVTVSVLSQRRPTSSYRVQ